MILAREQPCAASHTLHIERSGLRRTCHNDALYAWLVKSLGQYLNAHQDACRATAQPCIHRFSVICRRFASHDLGHYAVIVEGICEALSMLYGHTERDRRHAWCMFLIGIDNALIPSRSVYRVAQLSFIKIACCGLYLIKTHFRSYGDSARCTQVSELDEINNTFDIERWLVDNRLVVQPVRCGCNHQDKGVGER